MKKKIFLLGYYLKRPKVVKVYKELKRPENQNIETLKEFQNRELRKLISYVVKEIPYYRDVFNKLNLTANDIQTVEDLVKLPILTKEIIRKDPNRFIAKNHKGKIVKGSTGGSTGVPLKYRMSDEDYSRGVALLLRGFESGGYEPGDSMAIIAGASLTSKHQSLKSKIQDTIMNFKHFSSYGMSKNDIHKYVRYLNKKKPMYIRGYATSLYFISSYMKKNNLTLDYQPKAIYSTAEKLMPKQRIIIETVFKTKVFDNYGLNDGGVSAYECHIHNGMHIDFERSILEVTDDNGVEQIFNQRGKILATSLFNYAMPFIRYDTGDLGIISEEKCNCGCERPLLKEISGRVTDHLLLNGVYIGSPVLTILMGKVNVEQYQFIQTGENEIEIVMIKGEKYTVTDEEFIANSLNSKVSNISIKFKYIKSPEDFSSQTNKHKFIVNDFRD